MKIIEIAAFPNGAHRNQTGEISTIPDGYAEIPDGIEIPTSWPFVGITLDDAGHVTALTAGTVPTPEPEPDSTPTVESRVTALETETTQLKTAVDALASGDTGATT